MENSKIYSFFDESGTDGKSKFLALGLLMIRNIVNLHQVLESCRLAHHFKNEIKFEKASSVRSAIAQEWIEIFLNLKEASFQCLVIDKAQAGLPFTNLKKWPRFKLYSKLFLEKAITENNIRFYFDSYGKQQDSQFKEYLLTHIRGLTVIEPVNSKDYDALQLCDLLLGAVRAYFEKSITSDYKKKIIKLLQKKLASDNLVQVKTANFSINLLEEGSFI